MADNILDDDSQRKSPPAAKIMRPDSYHEDSASVPLSSLTSEMFEEPSHPIKVLEGLNRLRLNSALCDVILCCDGQEFPCHRYVLASFSSYFEAMFTSGMRESTQERVTISGVEPQSMGLLVNYAYTAKVSISNENVQALLAASDLLDITAVREACCFYMMRHIDIDNCVDIYCCAEDHSCDLLEHHSMDYILEHFIEIYHQEEFLSLSVSRVTDILGSDHLNVPKEDMVFEAAMLWLDRCPTHRQSFEKVLEQIRLPLISPSYLHTVVESLEVVKEQQGCQRFISEAKERPYCNTAHPRRTTVIVTVGRQTKQELERKTRRHKVESFDPLTSQWRTLGRLPLTITSYAVVMSGSYLYLAGGSDDSAHRDSSAMWRYDVQDDSWLEMAPMNVERSNFSMVMLGRYMFAVSGRGDKKSEDSIDRYDSYTNTWQLMESVGVAAYFDSICKRVDVVALDGLLYFIGAPRNQNLAQVAKFNPETSIWTEVPPMQILREQPAFCTLNGKIYAIGGRNYYMIRHTTLILTRPYLVLENTVECFNPKTNLWTMCAPMQMQRFGHSVGVLDGNIYVVGGLDDHFSRHLTIERYCEEMDTWETVGQEPDGCSNETGRYHLPLKLRNDHYYGDYYDDDDDDE